MALSTATGALAGPVGPVLAVVTQERTRRRCVAERRCARATPDRLRGLALLGIVIVNMPFLALSDAGFTEASTADAADRLTVFIVVAFARLLTFMAPAGRMSLTCYLWESIVLSAIFRG